jgi:CRISPR-associated protein Cas1
MTLLTEGKSVLYLVPRRGDSLTVSGKNYVIRDTDDKIRKKIPALTVRDILVFGETDLAAKVISLAQKNGSALHFLTGGGKFLGAVQFDYSKNIVLRQAQFATREAEQTRLAIARSFVEAKIHNQNEVFRRSKNPVRLGLLPNATGLAELRGYEGAAAKRYFEALKNANVIKNPDFTFVGRVKRPPTDPVNCLLSFAYSLLHSEMHTQLMIAGIDPYFGYLHDQRFGHAALASDFVEIFRGPVEHFIIKAINRREFTTEDFAEETGGAVKLVGEGHGKFFTKWTQYFRVEKFENDLSLTATIERDVRKFVHYLMGDDEEFIPFLWKQ